MPLNFNLNPNSNSDLNSNLNSNLNFNLNFNLNSVSITDPCGMGKRTQRIPGKNLGKVWEMFDLYWFI